MIVIIDPGHGMSNRRANQYDPGACADGASEAVIVMNWANELRSILKARKVAVVRTRTDANDPAPVGQRAAIAKRYKGDIMVSLHCNAADGKASGTETFYRGESNKDLASRLNLAVALSLGTKNRGVKTESQSQHPTLAVMAFQPCFLIELGFIDHSGDRMKLLDEDLRRKACTALADVIISLK